MKYTITPERIAEMKKYLTENPVLPQYEEDVLDGYIPLEQLRAKACRKALEELGELPRGGTQ